MVKSSNLGVEKYSENWSLIILPLLMSSENINRHLGPFKHMYSCTDKNLDTTGTVQGCTDIGHPLPELVFVEVEGPERLQLELAQLRLQQVLQYRRSTC